MVVELNCEWEMCSLISSQSECNLFDDGHASSMRLTGPVSILESACAAVTPRPHQRCGSP
jgi:hypothetical protein